MLETSIRTYISVKTWLSAMSVFLASEKEDAECVILLFGQL